jgi:hypothetical protein
LNAVSWIIHIIGTWGIRSRARRRRATRSDEVDSGLVLTVTVIVSVDRSVYSTSSWKEDPVPVVEQLRDVFLFISQPKMQNLDPFEVVLLVLDPGCLAGGMQVLVS